MNSGLSQLGRQLAGIWKQLGLNQRISVVVTGVAVLAALAAVAVWSGRTDYALLFGRLDESESSKVIAALAESKVPYELRDGGSVYVPRGKVHEVRAQLASKGALRGASIGFELLDQPNFGLSDFVQRANFTRALQGELERTIQKMDQVQQARVSLVMPENRLLAGSQQKPTASVLITVRGAGPPPPSTVNSIRLVVANAVEGLQVSNVSVVDNLGNVLSENEDDSVAGLSNNQLAARKNLEGYLSRKAEGMLEEVLGSRMAVVRVSADINWDTVTRFEEKYDPEGQVIRQSTIDDENVESGTPGSGGLPGMQANANADTNNVAGAGSNTSKTKKKTTTNQYEINRTVSNLMQSAGAVERLSAAVFVAQRYEGTGTARKPVARTPEELQKLRRTVQTALGIVENDPARTDQITLEEIAFNVEPLTEVHRRLDEQQRWYRWVDLVQKGLPPLLALVVMFLFWRSFKKTRPEESLMGLPLMEGQALEGAFAGAGAGGMGAGGAGRGGVAGMPGTTAGRGGTSGSRGEETPAVVTVEVLNQLIRENPASMTHAVRSWMNQGKPTS
ncbi:MAG: flagellar M-ring protein FliF [Verrucomicrobiales bacterium]|nr:flagellar M-ring protein FliF [Verrucomicrobiales bacterium]